MAKNNICSVLEFGKLPWTDIIDYRTYLGYTNPELNKSDQEKAEVDRMIEVFKNTK